MKTKEQSPTIIKKYANRRLYNTETSSYVTLEDLRLMVKDGAEFVVKDAKTGDDITRQILTQIILEQEAQGGNILPIGFLCSLIRSYGEESQKFLPPYLEAMMEHFIHNQQQLAQLWDNSVGRSYLQSFAPLEQWESMNKQGIEMFQQAISAFMPSETTKQKKTHNSDA